MGEKVAVCGRWGRRWWFVVGGGEGGGFVVGGGEGGGFVVGGGEGGGFVVGGERVVVLWWAAEEEYTWNLWDHPKNIKITCSPTSPNVYYVMNLIYI